MYESVTQTHSVVPLSTEHSEHCQMLSESRMLDLLGKSEPYINFLLIPNSRLSQCKRKMNTKCVSAHRSLLHFHRKNSRNFDRFSIIFSEKYFGISRKDICSKGHVVKYLHVFHIIKRALEKLTICVFCVYTVSVRERYGLRRSSISPENNVIKQMTCHDHKIRWIWCI